MKKIIGGIICLLLCCRIGFAQEDAFRSEWSVGFNAGATLSNMRFTPSRPLELLVQESGGLTFRYVSEKNFGIQVELNYSLRGWKEKTDTVVNLNQYSRSVSYLEAPITTYIYFNLGKRARLIFNVGPQLGCKIGEKVLEEKLVPSEDEYQKDLVNRYYHQKIQRAFDYGITGGMGFELCTGIGNFVLDGRYYFGLSDVFNNQKSDVFGASANQVIGIKLTYLYNIR